MKRYQCRHLSTMLCLALSAAFIGAFGVGAAHAQAQNAVKPPGAIDDGFFPFKPPRDAFAGDALVDLRFLNQERAGQDGWVKNENGRFVFEKTKQPVKFWGVNGTTFWTREPWGANHAEVDFQARRLAKIGVNLVRLWPNMGGGMYNVTPAHVDAYQYQVAAFAKQGIYSHLGFFWNFETKMSRDIPGYKKGANIPSGVLFYDKNVQEVYKDYARMLMATPDPYSSMPLAKNPAVAIIEIENEDNYFFWTFGAIKDVPAESREQLLKLYADWLTRKYGSLEKAHEAWGGDTLVAGRTQVAVPDDWAKGRPGFYVVYLLTGAGLNQTNRQRASDQAQFLTEQLRGFFADMAKWYRDELGFQGCILATNWTTADNRTLGALDKYANMGGDIMDRHAYHDTSKGNGGGGISPKVFYTDESLMKGPDSMTREVRYVGFPHIMTEYNYPMPNRFRAEFPWMAAVYGSLGNTDSFSFNELYGADWIDKHNRFSAYTPVVLGQFPALSMVFRKGYVQPGPVVYRDGEKLDDLYKLSGTRVWLAEKLDQLRQKDVQGGGGAKAAASSFDPIGYYVGQVELEIAQKPQPDVAMDLTKYIDRETKIVRSATGQLTWDWGQGLATCNAPCAQGATGFFPQDKDVVLGDVTLRMGNDYVSLMLVSLDGQPLATSGKMLLQVVTDDQNNGWKARPATFEREGVQNVKGFQVTSLGGAPIVVRKIQGAVQMTRPDAAALKVTALDYNSYARQEMPGGAGNIALLPDCLYYVIAKP